MTRLTTFLTYLLMLSFLGCSTSESKPKAQPEKQPQLVLPKVTDDRTDLVLSWDADGKVEVGSKVSDVPDEAKSEVRVQDPTIPPEARNPEIIFIADLTKRTKDGYQVTAENRADFEAKRQAEKEKAAKEAAEALAQAGGGAPMGGAAMPPLVLPDGAKPSVIMYATKHCPVCVKARRWLLEQKIPYVEKDLEVDQAAALELQKKGQAQGVSTAGVPMFEINGHLLPGFDPAQIVAMLVKNNGQQKTI